MTRLYRGKDLPGLLDLGEDSTDPELSNLATMRFTTLSDVYMILIMSQVDFLS